MRIIDAHMHLGEDVLHRRPPGRPSTTCRRWWSSSGRGASLFGTDLVKNIPVELAKYRALGLSEEQLEWCLGKTAASVFRVE